MFLLYLLYNIHVFKPSVGIGIWYGSEANVYSQPIRRFKTSQNIIKAST